MGAKGQCEVQYVAEARGTFRTLFAKVLKISEVHAGGQQDASINVNLNVKTVTRSQTIYDSQITEREIIESC